MEKTVKVFQQPLGGRVRLFSTDEFQLRIHFWQQHSFNEIQKAELAFQPRCVNHKDISAFSDFTSNSQKSSRAFGSPELWGCWVSRYCFGTAWGCWAALPPLPLCLFVPDRMFSFSFRVCASQRPQHTKAFQNFPSS